MSQYIKSKALDLLNQIPPGARRANFVLIVLVGIFLLMRYFPEVIGPFIVILMLTRFIYILIKRAAKLYPKISQRAIRKTWRLVVATRQFYKVSEETEFFHALTTIVVLITFVYFFITKDIHAFTIFNTVILMLLGAAAIFDMSSRISWLMKKAWAKVIGKAALAGLGAALIFIASAVAKQNVGELTQADPQYFPEFIGFLTSLYTPLLFGFVVACVLLLWALLEFLGVILILGLAAIVSLSIRPIFGQIYEARFFDRIRLGKKGRKDSEDNSSEWRGLIYVMRPIALGIATYIIASPITTISSNFSKDIEQAEKRILVMMHYHPNAECTNLDKKALVANLKDDGIVSVAYTGSAITFTKQKCVR